MHSSTAAWIVFCRAKNCSSVARLGTWAIVPVVSMSSGGTGGCMPISPVSSLTTSLVLALTSSFCIFSTSTASGLRGSFCFESLLIFFSFFYLVFSLPFLPVKGSTCAFSFADFVFCPNTVFAMLRVRGEMSMIGSLSHRRFNLYFRP